MAARPRSTAQHPTAQAVLSYSKMRASLPMYDWPEVRPSTDRFWSLIRERLRDGGIKAPEGLSREQSPEDDWKADGLLLSQTCGRPYANGLASSLVLLGIPAHAATGAPAGRYHSVLIARREDRPKGLDDLTARRFAFNARNSQSGYAAPIRMLIAAGAISHPSPLETGSHRQSIRSVANGEADWAAIDAVTWLLALRHEPAAHQLCVFCQTPTTPALPLIAGKRFAEEAEIIRTAFRAALADLPGTDADALFLTGFVEADAADYRPLAAPFEPSCVLPGLSA